MEFRTRDVNDIHFQSFLSIFFNRERVVRDSKDALFSFTGFFSLSNPPPPAPIQDGENIATPPHSAENTCSSSCSLGLYLSRTTNPTLLYLIGQIPVSHMVFSRSLALSLSRSLSAFICTFSDLLRLSLPSRERSIRFQFESP